MELKQIIRRIRGDRTQAELANELNVSIQAVSQWETGSTKPSPETMKNLGIQTHFVIDRPQSLKPVEKSIIDSLPRRSHDKSNCRVYGCLMCKQEV